MAEQRQRDIVVGETSHDWSDEMVAQWTVLADTIARTVRQETKLQEDHGKRKRAALEQEVERLRLALIKSEQRVEAATAEAREATDRLGAMQRHFEKEAASLERELGRRETVSAPAADRHAEEEVVPTTASRTDDPALEESPAARVHQEAVLRWAVEQQRSTSNWLGAVFSEQWALLRARPLLLPVSGFLVGLLVIAALYPALRRTQVQAKGASPLPTVKGESRAPEMPARRAAPGTLTNPASSTIKDASTKDSAGSDATDAPVATAALNEYAVLLAGGKTLTAEHKGESSAAYEAQLAVQAGYPTLIYQKNGRYIAAVPWDNVDHAEEGMKLVQAPYNGRWVRTSAIVRMSQWCPLKTTLEPIVVRNTNVPVWSCGTGPSIAKADK